MSQILYDPFSGPAKHHPPVASLLGKGYVSLVKKVAWASRRSWHGIEPASQRRSSTFMREKPTFGQDGINLASSTWPLCGISKDTWSWKCILKSRDSLLQCVAASQIGQLISRGNGKYHTQAAYDLLREKNFIIP
ncbi:hypothetical protein V2J09_023036 [Rumex salicifolius]